jgi:hypothetical protein
LLEGVGEIRIDSGAVPGPLCVVGDKAFPVVLGKSGSSFQPVVAAGQWGAGRVIAFGHTAAFWTEEALSHAETRRFLANCLFWAGRNATPLNVAVYRMPNLASFLRNDEELRRHQIRIMDWSQLNPAFFPQTHVLIVNSHDLSPAAGSLVNDFVRGGGGLLVGGLGWGWLQLNPGKSLQRDFPGNLLLSEMGILWADGYLERTTREGFVTSPLPGREHHALEAARLLASGQREREDLPDSVIEQASQTVALAVTVIPSNHPIRRLVSTTKTPSPYIVVPTPKSPIRKSDTMARAMLQLQVRQALEAETAVPTHPAAATFPGQVPPNANTIRKRVTIDTTLPGWQSTGLYAIAGRPITVEFDSAEAVGQVFIQIGCHTDGLWHLDEWKRVPEVVKRITVQTQRVTVASPFGGLIYLGTSRPRSSPGQMACQIDGAVEAPFYVHGVTTTGEWQRIRLQPAPWAELASDRIILTLPSEYVRQLEKARRGDGLLDGRH